MTHLRNHQNNNHHNHHHFPVGVWFYDTTNKYVEELQIVMGGIKSIVNLSTKANEK